ncbi:MAG: Acetoin:2,6-dichlorophenolindophenol oxidoreductase subunit alpha [Chlamydiia bacterium]|nr:Acetoin:2,6-dichlorophenolindophenol oxidoreductase subunit alpha [Chlamydiia bacterium]
MSENDIHYSLEKVDRKKVLGEMGKELALELLTEMILVRQLEVRGEAAYQRRKVGGFYHSSAFQEAIAASAVRAVGKGNWWIQTYRCHSLAIALGVTPNEFMAELFGKVTGNALGRGGSMHFFTDRLLGGYGIVGGHLPTAAGAAFSIKYRKKDEVAVCFLGDGAVAQGTFHETMNLASLWDLPLIVCIENNQWGMGTAVKRAICSIPIAENFAKGYGIDSISFNGSHVTDCYAIFQEATKRVKETKRPILMEAVCERSRGHSISDAALYRTKDELQEIIDTKDPIQLFASEMIDAGMLTPDVLEQIKEEQKEVAIEAVEFAENSPEPPLDELEQNVMAD